MMEGSASSARTGGRTPAAPYDPTMTTINNIDDFVHTIAYNPPVARGSQGQSAWTGAPRPLARVSPARPREKPADHRTLGTAGNSQDRNQPAAQPEGRPPRKPRRKQLRTKVRAGSCLSPQPGLNSNPPPGRAPERPGNSTAISTDQRCRKYCDGRSRPLRVTQAPRPPAVDPR